MDALCVTQGDWRKQPPGGDPLANSISQWPVPAPRSGLVPSRSPTTPSWSPVTHTLHASFSHCTQVSRKGTQYALLDTSLYNSCPAPKIEYSNSTHCFAAKIEAGMWSKCCVLSDKGGLYQHVAVCICCRLIKPVRCSLWVSNQRAEGK